MVMISKQSGACFFVGIKERKEIYILQKNNNRKQQQQTLGYDPIHSRTLIVRLSIVLSISAYTLNMQSRLCNTWISMRCFFVMCVRLCFSIPVVVAIFDIGPIYIGFLSFTV